MTLSHQDGSGDWIATTVSLQGTLPLAWEHGELRGGTNIVLLRQRKEYLGLFHSIGGFAYEAKKTYFMGAFTFSAEPPFQLRSVSHQPILDKDNALYDGWNLPCHGKCSVSNRLRTSQFHSICKYTNIYPVSAILIFVLCYY